MPHPTIIVGDIHGMTLEARRLFFELGVTEAVEGDPVRTAYGKTVRVISAGDVLDKGPDSVGATRFMRLLGAELVEGNHEDSHRRYRAGVVKKRAALEKKGLPFSVDKGRGPIHAISEALSDEDIAWLDSAKLWIRLPEFGALVVHAGIPPLFDRLPTDPELTRMGSKGRGFWEQALRIRYVRPTTEHVVSVDHVIVGGETLEGLKPAEILARLASADPSALTSIVTSSKTRPKGQFLSLRDQKPGRDDFWADVYGTDERGPRFGHVYFGHSPFIDGRPALFPHATGLDTGCVFGGTLTAAVLVPGQEPSFVSVPSSGKYATSLWEE